MLVVLAAIWGSAFLAIKVAVPEFGPAWLVTVRVTLGFLVLLPWALWRGIIWPNSGRQWLLVATIALLNVIAPFFLISWAELTIDAGVASLLMGTGPFLALIGSHFTTTDDRLNIWKLIAVVFGFAGVLTVIGVDAVQGLGSNLIAQGAALAGSICYVVSGVLIRKVDGIPPMRFATIILGISSLALLIGTSATVPLPALPGSEAIFAVVWLGLLPTGSGYFLRYYLIRNVGYSFFALGLNLIPVFGVGLAALVLGEPISAAVAIALALVVVGLGLARYGAAVRGPGKARATA
ncbi:MAG: DMT family transporter [Hyphomicrobiales bacterium]|nr:DMT family transporter [Hyphomicrobiales bacterium]